MYVLPERHQRRARENVRGGPLLRGFVEMQLAENAPRGETRSSKDLSPDVIVWDDGGRDAACRRRLSVRNE